MSRFITKIFGDTNDKAIKKLLPTVEQINSLEPSMQAMSFPSSLNTSGRACRSWDRA